MSIDACARMVEQADPDRFASAMCIKPLAQRADLLVLYAFNVEVARAPWVTKEDMIAEMRLQWWKDAITEIYDGKTVRKHEVVTPLAVLIEQQADALPRELFDDLIEARRFDIYRNGHGSNANFNRYISDTSANMMELSGRALGATDLEPFRQVGWASGLANLITALPALYAAGKDPIPLGEIDRNALIEGRVSQENTSIIKDLSVSGLSKISAAQNADIPKVARPALLAGWRAKRILRTAKETPEAVLRADFSVSQFRRAATLLWRNTFG